MIDAAATEALRAKLRLTRGRLPDVAWQAAGLGGYSASTRAISSISSWLSTGLRRTGPSASRSDAGNAVAGDVDDLQVAPAQPRHARQRDAVDAVGHHDVHQHEVDRLFRFQNFQRRLEIGRQRRVVSFAAAAPGTAPRRRSGRPRPRECGPCRRRPPGTSIATHGNTARSHHVPERLSLWSQASPAQESALAFTFEREPPHGPPHYCHSYHTPGGLNERPPERHSVTDRPGTTNGC